VNGVADGKRKLVRAALRLSARKRSFASLGLRELGREAGLNPNTFYRHFRSLDDLGLTIIEEITGDLRTGLREIRRSAGDTTVVVSRTVEYFFDFVRQNPDAFLIWGRELHGSSPKMRRELRRVMDEMAADMAEDIRVAGLAPGVNDATVAEVAAMIAYQMSGLALDYLERAKERRAIVERAVRFILLLTAGAQALGGAGAVRGQ
jgi:AcrR family transcriptional regulator